MKYTADELANKLEQKAKTLRENGITQEDMDMVSGGRCRCCGSSCSQLTAHCAQADQWQGIKERPEGSKNACIASSPD